MLAAEDIQPKKPVASTFVLNDGHTAFLMSNDSSNDAVVIDEDESVYTQFMRAHKCYDLIPTSSKVVVFDTRLPVKKAFFALVYNGVRSAPVWDSCTQSYTGMLTITDFINILIRSYKSSSGINHELEEHKISTWKEYNSDTTKPGFVSIDPNESLFDAVQALCEHRVHRLPILESATGDVIYVLTHKRILKFLYIYIYDLPKQPFMDKSPRELGIGTWSNIETVHEDCALIVALNKFISHRVSALPVLDSSNKVVDVYAKFDVINLAAEKVYDNLNISIKDALSYRSDLFEGVQSCLVTDSLSTVIEILVKAEVHRLVVTDEHMHVEGILSLSDILHFLVSENTGAKNSVKSAENHITFL